MAFTMESNRYEKLLADKLSQTNMDIDIEF